jgi:hypothetical protein
LIIVILVFVAAVSFCISFTSFLTKEDTSESKFAFLVGGILFILSVSSGGWLKSAYYAHGQIPYQLYNCEVIRTESDKAHYSNPRTGLIENLYGDLRFVNEKEYIIMHKYKSGGFYNGIYIMERSSYEVVPKSAAVEKL